jgi:radical SAM superfamily enzyme YgiQ (UPF0313 family)
MKILLVSTNTNRFLSPLPIGIAYLIPNLIKKGHRVRVLDLMHSDSPDRDIAHEIEAFKPDIAGFSIRNLDNHDMLRLVNPLPEIRGYIRIAKEHGIMTIIGGPAFTTLPEEMLLYMEADYGISGQGEDSLPQLLDMINGKTPERAINGLVWRENGEIRANKSDADGYDGRHPDWSLMDFKRYSGLMFQVPVVVKTGCSFSCIYCDGCEQAGYRMVPRNIDSIIRDIRNIIENTGTRSIYLSDPCLSYPPGFAKDLFKAIIKERLSIQFSANLEPARGCYDEELFELYLKAGGLFTNLGCESFSPAMLTNYRKPFTIDDVLEWSRLAKKTGLKFIAQLLFGGPGENESTVKETMAAQREIGFTILLYNIGIRIYPKTGLYAKAVEEGVIKDKKELLIPKFYVSRELDIEWARNYIERESVKYRLRMTGMIPVAFRAMLGRMRGFFLSPYIFQQTVNEEEIK